MNYTTIAEGKCYLLKFFDARSEGQEVAGEILQQRNYKQNKTLQQALRKVKYNAFDSRSSPASQIGKIQVMLEKSVLETYTALLTPPTFLFSLSYFLFLFFCLFWFVLFSPGLLPYNSFLGVSL